MEPDPYADVIRDTLLNHLIGPGGLCACRRFTADGDHRRTARHMAEAVAVRTATAWLIERGQNRKQTPPIYWRSRGELPSDADEWTADPWQAARFSTRAAAQEAIHSLTVRLEAVGDPVEHGFLTRSSEARTVNPERSALTTPSPGDELGADRLAPLTESQLTKAIGAVARVAGGELLAGGPRHWVGLSSAILEELARSAPSSSPRTPTDGGS